MMSYTLSISEWEVAIDQATTLLTPSEGLAIIDFGQQEGCRDVGAPLCLPR